MTKTRKQPLKSLPSIQGLRCLHFFSNLGRFQYGRCCLAQKTSLTVRRRLLARIRWHKNSTKHIKHYNKYQDIRYTTYFYHLPTFAQDKYHANLYKKNVLRIHRANFVDQVCIITGPCLIVPTVYTLILKIT
jgi:hypothetical protein